LENDNLEDPKQRKGNAELDLRWRLLSSGL
jgi:hypothetical protein